MLGVQTSIVRAALLVAFAALLDATLSPLLASGWVGPRFLILGVVVAVTGLRDLQALLLGFFGGVLTDALSGGIFGAGTLGGVLAAAIGMRAGTVRRKGGAGPLMAQAVAVSVAAYDLLGLFAVSLAGMGGPPAGSYVSGFAKYLFTGVIPDVLLNAVLAYLVGGRILGLIATKEDTWT